MAEAIYRLIALPACVPQSRAPGPIAKGPVTTFRRESTGAPSALSLFGAFPLSGAVSRSAAAWPSCSDLAQSQLMPVPAVTAVR